MQYRRLNECCDLSEHKASTKHLAHKQIFFFFFLQNHPQKQREQTEQRLYACATATQQHLSGAINSWRRILKPGDEPSEELKQECLKIWMWAITLKTQRLAYSRRKQAPSHMLRLAVRRAHRCRTVSLTDALGDPREKKKNSGVKICIIHTVLGYTTYDVHWSVAAKNSESL